MAKKEKKEPIEKIEREYIIPLRSEFKKVPKYKRTSKAIKAIKKFLVRHMKIYDRDTKKIKIDKYLNEFIWFRGMKKPPVRVKVKATKEGDIVKVELSELPGKLKFKKLREEKTEKKAEEKKKEKKAVRETPAAEEKLEEKSEQEIKEEKEKKAAVVEAGKEIEKAAAKQEKHFTKVKSKEPKRQQRFALQK